MPAASSVEICNMALARVGVSRGISSLSDATVAAEMCNLFYEKTLRKLLTTFQWPWTIRRSRLEPYSGDDYDAATSYDTGDLVEYGQNVYRSLTDANVGNTPSEDAANWFQVTRDGWGYTYPLPSDYLMAKAIWPFEAVGASGTVGNPSAVPGSGGGGSGVSSYLAAGFALAGGSYAARNPRASQRHPYAIENANDGTANVVMLGDLDTPVLQYFALIEDTAAFPDGFVDTLAWALAVELVGPLRARPEIVEMVEKQYKAALGEAASESMREQREDQEPVSDFQSGREA